MTAFWLEADEEEEEESKLVVVAVIVDAVVDIAFADVAGVRYGCKTPPSSTN